MGLFAFIKRWIAYRKDIKAWKDAYDYYIKWSEKNLSDMPDVLAKMKLDLKEYHDQMVSESLRRFRN